MPDKNQSRLDFTVQCIDKEITSDVTHELRANLDADYSHIVGIAISSVFCSKESILEQVKVKGQDLLPENFEAVHVMTSAHVEPNKRFFAWFKPVRVNGDEIVIRFKDTDGTNKPYNLQVQILMANHPNRLIDVLFA